MSICCKLSVRALAVILLAACVASQELNSTLYSTISGAFVAFENENIVFTCVARGSNHMGWSSDEYIGTGGRRLEFISTNDPGTNRTSGETRAELISASVDQFIISRLYISIQSAFLAATVQCQNIGAGTETSLPFKLADNGLSVTCDKLSVCPGETVTCVCATGGSDTLAWEIDGSRVAFPSTDSLLTRRNVTGLNAYGILTDRYNRNGIGVITSNLTVTASMSGTSLLIQCENVDRSTSSPTIISSSQNCPDPAETTSPPRTEPAPSTANDHTPTIIALAIICALLFVLLLAAILIAVIMVFGLKKKLIEKEEKIITLESDKQSLTEEKENEKTRWTKEKEALKERLEGVISDRDTKIKNLEAENKGLITRNQTLEAEKERLNTRIEEKDGKIIYLTAEKERLEGDINERDTKINNLRIKNTALNTRIKNLEERLTSELEKKNKEIQALKDKKQPVKKGASKEVGGDFSSTSTGYRFPPLDSGQTFQSKASTPRGQ